MPKSRGRWARVPPRNREGQGVFRCVSWHARSTRPAGGNQNTGGQPQRRTFAALRWRLFAASHGCKRVHTEYRRDRADLRDRALRSRACAAQGDHPPNRSEHVRVGDAAATEHHRAGTIRSLSTHRIQRQSERAPYWRPGGRSLAAAPPCAPLPPCGIAPGPRSGASKCCGWLLPRP